MTTPIPNAWSVPLDTEAIKATPMPEGVSHAVIRIPDDEILSEQVEEVPVLNAWSIPLDTEEIKATPVPEGVSHAVIRIPDDEELSEQVELKDDENEKEEDVTSFTLDPSKRYIVLDAGAIIASAKVTNRLIHQEVEFVTSPLVIQEIRNSKAKNVLSELPFTLKLQVPSTQSIKIVKEYAESTGDYSFLTTVDMQLLALAYELESSINGNRYIKKLPENHFAKKLFFKAKLTPYPNTEKKVEKKDDFDIDSFLESEDASWGNFDEEDNDGWISKENIQEHKMSAFGKQVDWAIEKAVDPFLEPTVFEQQQQHQEFENAEEETETHNSISGDHNNSIEAEEDSSKNITTSLETNYSHIGCMVTDFSMQNVLIHMGLNLISVEGYKVLSIRRFILRCTSCSVVVPDTTRVFCPNCGNHSTLVRVECVVDEFGEATFFYDPHEVVSNKGSRYQIPKPKGGKHIDPILREDSMLSVKRGLKRKKIRGAPEEFGDSLFAREYTSEGIFEIERKKDNIWEMKDSLVLGKPKPPPKKFKKKSRN